MSIAEPSPEQITGCFKIEQSLGFDALTPTPPVLPARRHGGPYQDLIKTGYTRVILDDAGRVSSIRGFVRATWHSIVERSLANNPAMLLWRHPSPDPGHSI